MTTRGAPLKCLQGGTIKLKTSIKNCICTHPFFCSSLHAVLLCSLALSVCVHVCTGKKDCAQLAQLPALTNNTPSFDTTSTFLLKWQLKLWKKESEWLIMVTDCRPVTGYEHSCVIVNILTHLCMLTSQTEFLLSRSNLIEGRIKNSKGRNPTAHL